MFALLTFPGRNILNILTTDPRKEITKGLDEEEQLRVPFVMSKDDMSQWLSGISAQITANDRSQDSGDVCMLDVASIPNETQSPEDIEDPTVEPGDIDLADISSVGETLPQLPDYEKFIVNSNAYQWLLSKVSQHDCFSNDAADAMTNIENQILNHFQTQVHLNTMSRSRPQALACMRIHLVWDPQKFMIGLGLDPRTCSIDTVLSLTGTLRESQATSITEYLHQTWPTTADLGIIPMLQQILTLEKGKTRTCECV